MYAIYGNTYQQYIPNASIYAIHGSYGINHPQYYRKWVGFEASKMVIRFVAVAMHHIFIHDLRLNHHRIPFFSNISQNVNLFTLW